MSKPLFPWIGGKRKLATEILPLFPDHKCYVEVFCGGAALFFMKDKSSVEVINDINGDLVNLYRVVQHHFEEFYNQFKWVLASREHFARLQQTPAHVLTDIQRAARFLYLQKLAFGGKVEGQAFGTATTARARFNLLSLENDLQDAHMRLNGVTIENLPWDKIITRYDRPHTLFYLDPPYWQTEGYGVDFPFEHYEKMAEFIRTIKGKMVISINDHPDIRKLFKGLPCKKIKYQYTVGGNAKASSCTELVYSSAK